MPAVVTGIPGNALFLTKEEKERLDFPGVVTEHEGQPHLCDVWLFCWPQR